jgi:hypothetical protein
MLTARDRARLVFAVARLRQNIRASNSEQAFGALVP